MSANDETTSGPIFTGRRDLLHDWALDLSLISRRWIGLEPTHSAATAVATVAARMEAQAASAQPDNHPRRKAVLYRSAGWMCLQGHGTDPSLLELASHCLHQARSLGSPETGELDKLERAIAEARDQRATPAPPRPLRLCCVCRISLDWSHHPPRPLTANELTLSVPAGHICSRCEWHRITENRPTPSGEPADVLSSIREVLTRNGRAADAQTVQYLH